MDVYIFSQSIATVHIRTMNYHALSFRMTKCLLKKIFHFIKMGKTGPRLINRHADFYKIKKH